MRSRAPFLCLPALLTMLMQPAHAAEAFIHGQSAAVCKPSNHLPTDRYEFDAGSLVNTAEPGSWADVFMAACPLSAIYPTHQATEYRIWLSDPGQNSAYCRVHPAGGRDETVEWVEWRGGQGLIQVATDPKQRGVDITAHCLIWPGASIDRLEVVFEPR
ncbi:hypothetical protein [Pseudomarimonas salicorniae]|uniref:Secreted protein n=1 Tax=Pseudomarimonas salicorniae TaxID=2933270 RepID=A0ABT0GCZ7_9GAMM|nr:hypothetical protein [Lysobacter sp. CAU 1642]MCK7592414.1 hypothetical protein [Lysobacter sp. CAU 1642]